MGRQPRQATKNSMSLVIKSLDINMMFRDYCTSFGPVVETPQKLSVPDTRPRDAPSRGAGLDPVAVGPILPRRRKATVVRIPIPPLDGGPNGNLIAPWLPFDPPSPVHLMANAAMRK